MTKQLKLRIFITAGIILLAIGIALIVQKCSFGTRAGRRIDKKIKEFIIQDSLQHEISAGYSDTAQYYLGRAKFYQVKSDSIRGDSSSYVSAISDLQSKISGDVNLQLTKDSIQSGLKPNSFIKQPAIP